jgi:hypothetical protein
MLMYLDQFINMKSNVQYYTITKKSNINAIGNLDTSPIYATTLSYLLTLS